MEEERRLLFVGMTRAEQELQLSLAQYRDFRGQRKPAIPSPFLMELPRGEMAMQQPEASRTVDIETETIDAPDMEFEGHIDPPHEDHEPVFRREEPRDSGHAKFGPGLTGTRLRVAAEMMEDGPRREGIDPDLFRQGMVVLHPEFGLGKVVALGGSGGERTAMIDFASAAGRKKLTLAGSKLRPVK